MSKSHHNTWSQRGVALLQKIPRTACFWVLLATMGTESVSAKDWTRFQDSVNSEGASSSVPLSWSPQEHIVWTAEIVGYGQSSPVTWGDKVFVTSISGPQKEQCHIAAYDLKSGARLWQHDLAAASQAENSNYVSRAAPTPVVDESGVYCFFEGGNLLALSHAGNVLWQRDLVQEYGAINARHGISASLEHMDERLFVWVERQEDPYVLAIEKPTGKNLWKVAGIGSTSWASPRLLPVSSGHHLLLSGVGSVTGLDPETGTKLWRIEGITGNSSPTPIPAGDGRFLIGATVGRGESDAGKSSTSNGLIAIKRLEDGTFNAEFVWRAKRATCSFGSPLVHREQAYFVNATGVVFCLDLATGEEKFSSRLGESTWATPFVINDRICFFGKSGTTSIIATGPEFDKVAENQTWEAVAAPAEAERPAATAEKPASEKPSASDKPATPPATGERRSGGRGGPGAGGGGGPVLYAAVLSNDRLLLRRGDRLYCIAGNAQ